MTERELRAALRHAPADAGARERSWKVVRAAYRELPRDRRPARPRTRRAGLALVACLAVAIAVTAVTRAPTDAVARWLRDAVGAEAAAPAPALGRLPAGSRLLVSAGGSAWVVAPDGAKRRLGRYDGASWSPRGLFVVGWRDDELTALEPDGAVRWSLTAPAPVRAARWAPGDGYRIAYVAGATLRIVNGDGSGDRLLGATRAGVAPAWRPLAAAHLLAWVDARGRVRVADVDARRQLWASGPLGDVRELAWSADGGRLLVRAHDRALVLAAADGGARTAIPLPAGGATAAAWSPRGRVALVLRDRAAARSELLLFDPSTSARRRLLALPGRLGPPTWSPDGRVLLVPWPDADEWLLLADSARGGRVDAVEDVAAQFAPGSTRARFPSSVEWAPAAAQRAGG
jgi:hypothetical protein